ncbi:hypothetical protein GCM10023143_07270 [Compostibacter hankyongensis]|uniref:Alpha-L-rhamnosidase six-hairpin glycosidase domain-containing protein n=2 Tax=Compostibacter hankyongensis TaxID=1007089 RepID=A0ABP8FH17_9BACT
MALGMLILQTGLCPAQSTGRLENDAYRITVLPDNAISLMVKGTTSTHRFAPVFMVMHRDDDPHLVIGSAKGLAFKVPAWKLLTGKGNTMDFFSISDTVSVSATRSSVSGNRLRWNFPQRPGFSLEAELYLPPGKEDPVIQYRMKANQSGWYSVGYTGAPQTDTGQVNAIWQPLIWQERRFPYMPFLSMEFMCSIPGTLVNSNGYTTGVVADPSEIPFRFSNIKNSRFGVLVRNPAGEAQPMLFAPVPGGDASHLQPGDTAGFRFRIIVRKDDLFDAYKYVAQHVMGFRDYRQNATCSLNETLENMIDYAMNDEYSGWNKELKAPDYATDVPGTVKAVSALHPLSIAMITDNKQVYTRRALPSIEYLISREKYLYSEDTAIKRQSPSHYLKGPAAEVSELAALYEMSGDRSPVFKHYAEDLYGKPRVLNLKMVSKGESWQNALALYRMNGKQEYLDKAKAGADEYIQQRITTPQTDFSDVHIETGGQFWTDFAPKWIDLLELYEATKEKRYLDAATKGAQLFVQYIWMEPTPPAGDVLINKEGNVGMYAHQNRLNPDPQPMKAPEQRVPAWRVAQTGLVSEAATTYTANRAVFLAHHAAYLLRLAYYTGDTYFRDIARAAIVGRYANFPGYSIMGEYTTLYGRPDYPLHSLREITYNNIYYNHIWPQITLLMDYLLSDVLTSSKGKIDFPDHYAQGYAYLQSKVYGDRPGTFYGDRNVRLWMPAKLIRMDNIQANYVAGYGNGNLYIALMNQSAEPQQVTLRLNPDLVPLDPARSYKVRIWQENKSAAPAVLRQGAVTVSLKPHGITALAIDGLRVTPEFTGTEQANTALPEQSYAISETPLGKVTGMILTMGASMTNAYIWLQATEKELKEVSLHYLKEGKWETVTDTAYPYEFSIPLTGDDADFSYRLEGIDVKGAPLKTETVRLRLK